MTLSPSCSCWSMNSDTAFPADGVSVEMLTGPDVAGSAATPQQDVWPEGRAGAEEGEAGPDPGREGGQEEGEGGARHPDSCQGLPIFFTHGLCIIADPEPFWPRDLGWLKKQDPDPGWTTRIVFSGAWKQFFELKYLDSLMRIRLPGWKKFGSGINISDPQHCIILVLNRLRIGVKLITSTFIKYPAGVNGSMLICFLLTCRHAPLPFHGWRLQIQNLPVLQGLLFEISSRIY